MLNLTFPTSLLAQLTSFQSIQVIGFNKKAPIKKKEKERLCLLDYFRLFAKTPPISGAQLKCNTCSSVSSLHVYSSLSNLSIPI